MTQPKNGTVLTKSELARSTTKTQDVSDRDLECRLVCMFATLSVNNVTAKTISLMIPFGTALKSQKGFRKKIIFPITNRRRSWHDHTHLDTCYRIVLDFLLVIFQRKTNGRSRHETGAKITTSPGRVVH